MNTILLKERVDKFIASERENNSLKSIFNIKSIDSINEYNIKDFSEVLEFLRKNYSNIIRFKSFKAEDGGYDIEIEIDVNR